MISKTGDLIMSLRSINTDALEAGRRAVFGRFVREMVLAKGDIVLASKHAELTNAAPDVRTILRAAVAVGTTSDAAWAKPLVEYTAAAEAFLNSLRYRSVFDTVRLSGAMELPPITSAVSVATGISAGDVSEGGSIPVARMTMATNRPAMKTAGAIVAITEEVIRLGLTGSSDLLNTELAKAATAAVDSAWLASLYSSVTPTASSGSTTANKQTDLAALIGALVFGPGDSIVVSYSPPAMAKLALATTTTGDQAFEGLGVTGGQYAGIVFVPSDQLPTGAALAIVANGFIIVSDPPLIDASTQGDIQFDTAPDSPPSFSTNLVSLWQTGMIGMRVIRRYGSAMARPASVSALSGVAY